MPFCPMCGAAVAATHRFCADCGAELPARARGALSLQPESPAVESMEREDAAPASPHDERPQGNSPVPVRDLLGSAVTQDRPGGQRVAIGVGMVALIVGSAVGGYMWFRPAPQTLASVASAEHTEQQVDAPPIPPTDNDQLWTLVADDTRETTDADAILGKADGRSAAISAGGTVALAYAGGMAFYNGEGADVRLDGPADEATRYTIFARGGPQERWLRFDVNRRGFPGGFVLHDFGHHEIEQATQILIRNDGSINLYIDAVTPLHLEPEAHEAPHARGGAAH
jgi:hypothetical protein